MSEPQHTKNASGKGGSALSYILMALCLVLLCGGILYASTDGSFFSLRYEDVAAEMNIQKMPLPLSPQQMVAYDKKLLLLAHEATTTSFFSVDPAATSSAATSSSAIASTTALHWPARSVYPDAGALLPFKRIIAYYGNFYSAQMGVLGAYPPSEVLAMLASTSASWESADPSTPVVPAIDYIAVAAQGAPGSDNMYRARMPLSQIQKAIDMAGAINGIVILDVQLGLSNVETELPLLKPYLELPEVELALDPEFAMKKGEKPGTVIGSLDASEINYASQYLGDLVEQYDLPPKVLVIHRFTEDMVTHYKNITPLPQVQIVMDMDGWGYPEEKVTTYKDFIASEPVQFTGLKLFYKADLQPPSLRLLTPQEILDLTPSPSYIQYE